MASHMVSHVTRHMTSHMTDNLVVEIPEMVPFLSECVMLGMYLRASSILFWKMASRQFLRESTSLW